MARTYQSAAACELWLHQAPSCIGKHHPWVYFDRLLDHRDIESYGAGSDEAVFLAKASGDIRLWGMHGRLMAHDVPVGGGNTPDYGLFDVEAKSFLNLDPVLGRVVCTQAKHPTASEIWVDLDRLLVATTTAGEE